jgi:hypothetical protein
VRTTMDNGDGLPGRQLSVLRLTKNTGLPHYRG